MTRRQQWQRGSVTLWTVIVTVGLLMVVGLVVDGGAKLRATQKADQLAREAARAGAQQLTMGALMGTEVLKVDPVRANEAARDYLAASDASLTNITVTSSTVTVHTAVVWKPVLLSAFGFSSLTVNGEGSADAMRSG